MELTTRERRHLGEIDERLLADEPRLRRALSALSTRSLRAGQPHAIRALATGPHTRDAAYAAAPLTGRTRPTVTSGHGPAALERSPPGEYGRKCRRV